MPPVTSVQRTIASEIERLASFYEVSGPKIDAAVRELFFDFYTEIILGREGFEVVVGAVDARDRLSDLAEQLGVERGTVRLFRAFSDVFPRRIGYLKLCFGQRSPPPTMHCGAILPWSDVLDFTAQQDEFAGAAANLMTLTEGYPLCHLVGFTSDRECGAPVMKLYWLLDQRAPGSVSSMLASARLSHGRVRGESKRYLMGARWDQALRDLRWDRVIEIARREFGDSAWLCTSELSVNGDVHERKVYVFRHDSRVPECEKPRTFNLYYAEGVHHLRSDDLNQAIRSFSNALVFQRDHAHAYNNRGYCWIQRGEFWRAIADCVRARALDATISTNNLNYARERAPGAMGTAEWLAFEESLASGVINVQNDAPDRPRDLLDLADGTAILGALFESEVDTTSPLDLVLEPNRGDGDCLFHALAGSDLHPSALLEFRKQIASVRLRMPEDPRGNALRVMAALLQTPFTRERGLALVAEGVVGLRNDACAALQSVPGVFAGEPEIEQWCALTQRQVGVLEANGALRLIGVAGASQRSATREWGRGVQELLNEGTPVLLKRRGHWQRIVRVCP